MNSLVAALGLLQLNRMRKAKGKKRPIVFVPGLYGSMGDEIIPGTGDWHFGIAESVYGPFIEQLEEIGYTRDKDLFIAFYDWRKSCNICAKKYLKSTINKAKKKSGYKKVNIISHSMGGLVSRAYAQSNYYEKDIEELILVGTPNAGSANAYYFWEGGIVPSDRTLGSTLYKSLVDGYLWVLKKSYGTETDMETIRKYLKSTKDLLPSRKYGQYIYTLNRNNNKEYIEYEKMAFKNDFLDNLNKKEYILKRRNIKVLLIGGNGFETNDYIRVERELKSNNNEWPDGRAISSDKSKDGDGTVMLKSAFAIEGDQKTFSGKHTELLQKCSNVIFGRMGIQKAYIMQKNFMRDYISIRVSGKGKVSIKELNRNRINSLYNETERVKDVQIESYGKNLRWIMVRNQLKNRVYLEYEATENEDIEILIEDSLGRHKIIKEKNVPKNKVYRMRIS
ncbi:lipase family alpha/beta hydrolase [Anaeromicrobium sediminis]|uniref:Uncharacterized protein n=1 Tax=Anaeromicrobium sediminis TaxID=1478221 RepID=A0A267MMD0_9FIRM|nr:alpha/beta fold hydrolase [Anaeromicrobium sediminis]PAB60764.1 hypothetical protein CCE28_04290 [Anaeromicrobium sediminis]